MKSFVKNIRQLIKYKELFYEFASRDIKARYKQSILGVGWALLQPVAMMVIFSIVFGRIAKIDVGIAYPVFAFAGLLPWTFFSNTINKGVNSLTSNINLVTKLYFPREIFPFSTTVAAGFDLLVGLSVLLVLLFVYKIPLTLFALWFFVILAIQTIFGLGLALILSAMNVFFRDMIPLSALTLQIWMYLTPVVYPSKLVPEKYMFLFNLNPLTPIMNSYKNVLLFQKGPDPMLWYSFVIALVVFVGGYKIFKHLEPKFADII